jgi:hypothetical protein
VLDENKILLRFFILVVGLEFVVVSRLFLLSDFVFLCTFFIKTILFWTGRLLVQNNYRPTTSPSASSASQRGSNLSSLKLSLTQTYISR